MSNINKRLHVYCASGWFNAKDQDVLSRMESYTGELQDQGIITVHRPRIDGIELKPGEFHDPALRSKVFECNVTNIDQADVVLANLTTSSSTRYDTGTVWEVGYAVRSGKCVLIVDDGATDLTGIHIRMSDLLDFPNVKIFRSLEDAITSLLMIVELGSTSLGFEVPEEFTTQSQSKSRPLILLPSVGGDEYNTLVEVSQEIYGRYVAYAPNIAVSKSVKSLVVSLPTYDYVVVPVGRRDSMLIYLMGVAYASGIPVISYSDSWDSVNLMLIASVRRHLVGTDDLTTTLLQIQRGGIDSLPEFTGSDFKVY